MINNEVCRNMSMDKIKRVYFIEGFNGIEKLKQLKILLMTQKVLEDVHLRK